MAYREVSMWEVLEVLRRLRRGEGVRKVARATGHERKTVRRYRELAEGLGWVATLHEPDEALAPEVFRLPADHPDVKSSENWVDACKKKLGR